jgi:hypothetical protein
VQVLVQALLVPADVIRLGWLTWSCKALMALCDPAISFLPMSFIERRLAEDCASFEDCRIIASALSSLFEVSSRWDQCMSDTFSTLIFVLVKFVDDEGFSLPVG